MSNSIQPSIFQAPAVANDVPSGADRVNTPNIASIETTNPVKMSAGEVGQTINRANNVSNHSSSPANSTSALLKSVANDAAPPAKSTPTTQRAVQETSKTKVSTYSFGDLGAKARQISSSLARNTGAILEGGFKAANWTAVKTVGALGSVPRPNLSSINLTGLSKKAPDSLKTSTAAAPQTNTKVEVELPPKLQDVIQPEKATNVATAPKPQIAAKTATPHGTTIHNVTHNHYDNSVRNIDRSVCKSGMSEEMVNRLAKAEASSAKNMLKFGAVGAVSMGLATIGGAALLKQLNSRAQNQTQEI